MKRATMICMALLLGACYEAGRTERAEDDETGGQDPTSMSAGESDPSASGPTSVTQGATGDPTGDPTGMDDSSGDDGSESSGEPDDPGEYDFQAFGPEEYDQVDRMGMPAINTAVISSKDQYNRSGPADDAAGTFVPEIVENLTGLHDALDDDLTGAGLVPCTIDQCVAQAAPLVVPDTIKITIDAPAGFPNGRLPADPVMDVTLAVVLLDLTVEGQDALALVGLNPTENDVPFSDSFPYFAEPH